jgi:hypothetical protein
MKKVLLSMAVVAALGMSSCGGEDSKEGESKDELCCCITEMMSLEKDLDKAYDDEDDAKYEEISEKFQMKEKECRNIAEKLGEDEVKKIFDNCEAAKGLK